MEKINITKLAELLLNLPANTRLELCEHEDGSDVWSAFKQNLFGGEVLIYGYHGGHYIASYNTTHFSSNDSEEEKNIHISQLSDSLIFWLGKSEQRDDLYIIKRVKVTIPSISLFIEDKQE